MLKAILNKKGSALITALLVMGVLIAISLVLSSLIFRESRITRNLLDAGRAYYAAESAVENALYAINTELPGWEPEVGESGFKSLKVGEDLETVAEFKVNNRCQAYPCFDDEFDKSSLPTNDLKAYYDVLELNESITIPLFVVKEGPNGVEEVPVKDFTVEFFAPFDPDRDLKLNYEEFGRNLAGWDVMRWKILGLRKDTPNPVTETISDFTALAKARNARDLTEEFVTHANFPSWFGTVQCDLINASERYSDEIKCIPYQNVLDFQLDEPGQISTLYAGTCSNTQAREYYDYGIDRRIESEDVRPCYEIGEFLDSHKLNYLTLTNLMNPAILDVDSQEEKLALSKLYFRVELFGENGEGGETVREVADIVANGYSGNSKKSINVQLRRGSFIPVFHFALYSTHAEDRSLYYEE